MEQLFLLEIVVDTIYFESVDKVPSKKQIILVATFGNFATLEIRTDTLGALDTKEISAKRRDIEINFGKSYLFSCKPDDLLKALEKCPLEVILFTKADPNPIGKATIVWDAEFMEMVGSSRDSVGYITPAYQGDAYPLLNRDDITGEIDMFIRMSCFGKSITTNMQIVKEENKDGFGTTTKFLFKSTNAATTFECQMLGMGTTEEFIPVGPIFQATDIPSVKDNVSMRQFSKSTETITNESRMPSAFVLDQPLKNFTPIDLKYLADMLTSGGTESLIVRPDDKLFMNLQDLYNQMSGSNTQSGSSTIHEDDDIEHIDLDLLTSERIEKMLCKNKDCPAVKKFKEYGIGPLATGKSLGTLYNLKTDIPTTYGLSHTVGTINRYGPYGVYSRPKRLNQPFIPKDTCSRTKTETTYTKGSSAHTVNKPIGDPSTAAPDLTKVQRLRGGGPIEDTSPMSKCKDLMEDFDRVVDQYKKALGPCGQATCPFSQNLVIESCRKECNHPDPISPSPDSICSCLGVDDVSACGNDACPFLRADNTGSPVVAEFKKAQLKSACGEPSCPYMATRLGMDGVDQELNCKLLQFPKNCGGQSCPFKIADPLPPIHWDCPEPLPSGKCRNPQCPIEKQNHIINCVFTAAPALCGNTSCPYSPPQPCDFKGCPFAPPSLCPSFCPYRRDPHIKCPYATDGQSEQCIDPSCPFNVAADGGDNCSHISPSICSNIDCPYGFDDNHIAEDVNPCTFDTCKSKGGLLDCGICGGGPKCLCENNNEELKKDDLTKDVPNKTTDEKRSKINLNIKRDPSKSNDPPSGSPSNPHISTEKLNTKSASGSSQVVKIEPKKRRSPFVYDEGDRYPGIHVGHKYCQLPTSNVPRNMGWLWNIKSDNPRLKHRRGWRPGAITKIIADRIEEYRRKLGILSPNAQKAIRRRKKRNANGGYESESDDEVPPKPTLQIKKKDGCYWITMSPLKDPYSLEDNENPYMECTPLQFKIEKQKKEPPEKSCFCGGDEPESSESDLDIEFTPPAGIIHPDRLKRKKNIVHITTQYDPKDYLPKPKEGKIKKEKKGKKGKGKGKGKKGKGKKGKGKGKRGRKREAL